MNIQKILSELKKEGWHFNEDFIKNNEDMLQAIADKTLALQLQQTGVVGRSEQLCVHEPTKTIIPNLYNETQCKKCGEIL